MKQIIGTTYLSNVDWLHDVAFGENIVLRSTSALEYLELFNGYLEEEEIYIYAETADVCADCDNVECIVVDSFDGIETVTIDGVRCTTINQTVNDMLSDYDNADETALFEALSNYYYKHGETFDGLKIAPENLSLFNYVKKIAENFYTEV